jgi:hypothetical protein
VTVIFEVPELPAETVMLVAANVNDPLEEVVEDPSVTTTDPVEPAYVESPEYVASITCDPAVVEEKEYVAEPVERASDDVCVVPSTVTLTVPVGVVASEVESEATVMVMVSLAPEAGVLVEAESVVVEAVNEEAVVEGHAVSSL